MQQRQRLLVAEAASLLPLAFLMAIKASVVAAIAQPRMPGHAAADSRRKAVALTFP